MEARQIVPFNSDSSVAVAYERIVSSDVGTLVGAGRFEKGSTHPESGWSIHDVDEYSFVISGCCVVTTPHGSQEFHAGAFTMIPAGEPHRVEALADTEVLWWLLGNPKAFDALKSQYPWIE
ncbi:cupin domain-containing protein [Burkholderia sp. PU8-34]